MTRAGKAAVLVVSLPIGACLMAVAIATTDHAWLGWFALVPLFFAIRSWRPLYALFGGALWGASLYISCVLQPHATVPATFGNLALLTTVPAVYSYLGALVTRAIGFNPFVLAVGWMGVELAFGAVDPHIGLLGGATDDSTFLVRLARGLGYVLAAFIVASVNASLVSLLGRVRLRIPTIRRRIAWVDCGATIAFHRFFCFPLFASRPSQPRAPPGQCSSIAALCYGVGSRACAPSP